jgi:hypothetical protein
VDGKGGAEYSSTSLEHIEIAALALVRGLIYRGLALQLSGSCSFMSHPSLL